MAAPRGWAAEFVFNNKMYIMGGWAGGYQSDVWMYDPLTAPPAHQIRNVDSKGKLIVEWGTIKIPK